MKKRNLLSCLLAALLLCGLSFPALAQSPATLLLGDQVPIAYLESFESRMIRHPAMLPGITGKVDLSFQMSDGRLEGGQGLIDIHVTNIALTDDVLAVFFKATFPQGLPLEYGTAQESYNQATPTFLPLWEGENLPFLNIWQEGHPVDGHTLLGLNVYTLKTPLADGGVLSFDLEGGHVAGLQLKLDKSKAQDPSRASLPDQEIKLRFLRQKDFELDYQLRVVRLSFGPFGNRLLFVNRDVGRETGGFPFLLTDKNGEVLPLLQEGYRSSSLASPVNPVDMSNEIWFLGGENERSLSLVPLQIQHKDAKRPAPGVLHRGDALPKAVTLFDQTQVMVHRFEVTPSGFTVFYTARTPRYLIFDPGDAKGQTLKYDFVTFSGYDLPSQTLVASGLWMAEHKGQPVSRLTPEQIQDVQSLVIQASWRDDPVLLYDQAVSIPTN